MCGIVGIVGRPPDDPDQIRRMTATLDHRGPDDSGVWRSAHAHLGHTRLAILDLSSAGHQPMEHGDHVLVYNGEIYNFRELRRELTGPFHSETDTEVLLRLLAEEGPSAIPKLRGMFAFAVWDRRNRRLVAARDRLGIKPLFYRELPGGIAFASELKALLELGRPKVDPTAIRDFFTYRVIPTPKTVYAGIRKLPPGSVMTWEDGRLRIERYWHPEATCDRTDAGAAVDELDSLLRTVVPEHTLADVPVGVFLSGGIDSTTVVAFLDRPRTFTLGQDVRHRDESPAARVAAEHFGTDHREVFADALDLESALDTAPKLFDEPFGDSSAWATYLVSGLARSEVTVALSGEGGDELFAGYQWYSRFLLDPSSAVHRFAERLIPPFTDLGRSCQRRAARGLERYATFLAPFTLTQKRALLHPDLLGDDYDDLWLYRQHWRPELHPIKRMQWADLHAYLPEDLLTKVDRASMAHSLEVRPPMLDHRLVEFALGLDPVLMRDVPGNRGKLLVRRLMADRVPPGHFDRPKRGFNLPIRRWVRRDPAALEGALDRLAEAAIIRRPRRAHFKNEQTWALLVLDRWMTSTGAV